MIDFRYHLVSIVAVFLALAVGIVLGAGPLQQQLGQTLTTQVSDLRRDKASLRSELDTAQRRTDAAEEFANGVSTELVRSRLGGRSVVLVLLPGADTAVAGDLAKTLQAAGATVSGRVQLQPAWADPDKVAAREQLAARLAPSTGLDAGPSDPVDARMGALLAKALVVGSVTDTGPPTPQSAKALSGLREGGMLSVDGNPPVPATLAVVVAGPPDLKAGEQARDAALATWATTINRLDAASSGAVAVGPTESTEPVGVLGALRGQQAIAANVSSVDDVQLAMGRIAVVYALRQQMTGQSGQYGTGVGAGAVLPPLPAGVS